MSKARDAAQIFLNQIKAVVFAFENWGDQ